MLLAATDYPLLNVFLSMLYFFLFFVWILLLFRVFADVFRSRDIGGVAKTLWIVFVIVLPFLGVFVYLIARGHRMAEHEIADVQAQDAAMRDYIRSAAGPASPTEELARLAELRDRGAIDEAEFAAMKLKVLA